MPKQRSVAEFGSKKTKTVEKSYFINPIAKRQIKPFSLWSVTKGVGQNTWPQEN